MRNLWIYGLLCLLTPMLSAQKVTVSPDINIRSDISYHLLGRVDDQILLFRDQNGEMIVHIYDDDLVLRSERQVNLISDQSFLYNFSSTDSTFSVLYGYSDEEEHVVQMDVFSSTAALVDSLELSRTEKQRRGLSYKSTVSEDGNVIALYRFVESSLLRLLVVDTESKRILTNSEFLVQDYDLEDDLEQIEVSDAGHFLMMQDINASRSRRENHYINVLSIPPGSPQLSIETIHMKEHVTSDIALYIDNHNNQKGVVALYDEKRASRSKGYAWVKGPLNGEFTSSEMKYELFDDLVMYELNGNNKDDYIENFIIADVLVKANGMPILLLEMSLDVQRSPTGNTTRTARTSYSRGRFNQWSDHYREDIIAVSLGSDGSQEWHQIFYKRQLSQNDQAIYSSFFPFKTPSRIRLLFNDVIKENSSVSEYIFDGLGNHKRNSVLSTEYQNLKLRFTDAVQLSGDELIIPSQNNFTLNLVKIDYGL